MLERAQSPRFSALSLVRAARDKSKLWGAMWRSTKPKARYDVVIVGAGGHGLATAYHLVRDHGVRSVAVLERNIVGYGNIGRNTTIVRSNYLLPENQAFYEDSLRRWKDLSKVLNFNVMYSPRGVVSLAGSDDEMNALARRGNAMRLAGIDAELLDGAALLDAVPVLANRDKSRFPIIGGLRQPRGGTVRHDAVAWGYARAASDLGVDIVEHCHVEGVVTTGGTVTGVETSLGPIGADRVLFAVGGHCGHIGAMLGVKLPVETHMLQAMVTEPTKPLLHTVLMHHYDHAEIYMCQSDRGGLVLGGILDGPPSYTQDGDWARLEEVAQGAQALLPQTAGLRILRHWAGINDMTMDGSPIVDRIAHDNVFLNGGWCYGGFKAIPASGAACAQFVATGTAPDLIAPFRLSRFETGHILDERGAGPFPVRQ